MSFRLLVITLLSSSLLVSCKWFDESPPKLVSDTKLGFESQCLSNVLPVMQQFMDGTAVASDVSGMWSCFGFAIQAFEKKVRGVQQSEYTSREIASFFETYFLDGIQINDRLLLEVMHIKQIFIGGSDNLITRDELAKLVAFSTDMQRISLNILPYMKVYSQNWNIDAASGVHSTSDINVQFFESSNLAMQQAVKDLAAIIAKNNCAYTLDNLVVLLQELQSLYGASWSWLDSVKEVMPLVEKLKGALTGGDPNVVSATDWEHFGLLSGRGYIQYLRYYYFIQHLDHSSSQLTYLANSLTDLFSYLGDMVSQKPSGTLSKTELGDILNSIHNIYPSFIVTDAFLNEAMKFKVMLFGGAANQWVPSEFDNAKSKVEPFRIGLERIWAYSDLYAFNWNPGDLSEENGQKYFKNSEINLIASSKIFSGLVESSYDLQGVQIIADELAKMLPNAGDSSSWVQTFKKYIPVGIAYKKIVLSDDSTVIQKSQWQDFLSYTAEVYSRALYLNYFILPRPVSGGPGLASLDLFAQDSSNLLKELIKRRSGTRSSSGVVSFKEIDELIDGLYTAEILPSGVDAKTVQDLMRVILYKILITPESRLAGVLPTGFGLDAIDVIQNEYSVWSANEHALENLGSGHDLTTAALLAGLKKLTGTAGIHELQLVFDSVVSLSLEPKGRLYLTSHPKGYDLNSLANVNISRAIFRLIIRSYAMDKTRIDNYVGITLAEAQQLYADAKPTAVGMGIIAQDNMTFGKSRFYDANLFMPSSDGDDYINLREGTHLALMIFSGMKLNSMISASVADKCQVNTSTPAAPKRVKVDCALQVYYDQFKNVFDSMPDMVSYVSSISKAQATNMLLDLLKAAGWVQTDPTTATVNEIALLPHILQYIEVVMQRFDLNHDGHLDDAEAKLAYPTYAALIQKMSKTSSDKINRAAFYYLLKSDRVPKSFQDIMDLLLYLVKAELLHQPIGINTDRAHLGTIFGAIADSIGSTSFTIDLNPPTIGSSPELNELRYYLNQEKLDLSYGY